MTQWRRRSRTLCPTWNATRLIQSITFASDLKLSKISAVTRYVFNKICISVYPFSFPSTPLLLQLTLYWTRGDVGVERKSMKMENGTVQKKQPVHPPCLKHRSLGFHSGLFWMSKAFRKTSWGQVAFLSKNAHPSATYADLVAVCIQLVHILAYLQPIPIYLAPFHV